MHVGLVHYDANVGSCFDAFLVEVFFFFWGGVCINSTSFLGLKNALAFWIITRFREREIWVYYRGDGEVSLM